jgi:hypothetical protein
VFDIVVPKHQSLGIIQPWQGLQRLQEDRIDGDAAGLTILGICRLDRDQAAGYIDIGPSEREQLPHDRLQMRVAGVQESVFFCWGEASRVAVRLVETFDALDRVLGDLAPRNGHGEEMIQEGQLPIDGRRRAAYSPSLLFILFNEIRGDVGEPERAKGRLQCPVG